MLIALPNLGEKRKVEIKKEREGKEKAATRIPVFFYLRSSKGISISFCKEFFLAFILFFQSHIAENEAEMTLLLPVCGDFD